MPHPGTDNWVLHRGKRDDTNFRLIPVPAAGRITAMPPDEFEDVKWLGKMFYAG